MPTWIHYFIEVCLLLALLRMYLHTLDLKGTIRILRSAAGLSEEPKEVAPRRQIGEVSTYDLMREQVDLDYDEDMGDPPDCGCPTTGHVIDAHDLPPAKNRSSVSGEGTVIRVQNWAGERDRIMSAKRERRRKLIKRGWKPETTEEGSFAKPDLRAEPPDFHKGSSEDPDK